MRARYDVPWIPGKAIYGDTGLGVTGAVIRATTGSGVDGSGVLYDCWDDAGDDAKTFCARVTSGPTSGALFLNEDGSLTWTDAYGSFTFNLLVDGALVGVVTVFAGEMGEEIVPTDLTLCALGLSRSWRRRRDVLRRVGAPPSVSGTFGAGQLLTANPGSVAASAVIYQWLRSGAPIDGANANTYTVQAGDVGRRLQCAVTLITSSGPIPYAVDVV